MTLCKSALPESIGKEPFHLLDAAGGTDVAAACDNTSSVAGELASDTAGGVASGGEGSVASKWPCLFWP